MPSRQGRVSKLANFFEIHLWFFNFKLFVLLSCGQQWSQFTLDEWMTERVDVEEWHESSTLFAPFHAGVGRRRLLDSEKCCRMFTLFTLKNFLGRNSEFSADFSRVHLVFTQTTCIVCLLIIEMNSRSSSLLLCQTLDEANSVECTSDYCQRNRTTFFH